MSLPPAFRAAVLGLITLAAPAAAQPAPSFDCAKAGAPVEQTICQDLMLSWFDAQLATVYGATRARLGEADRTLLRDEQRAWIGQRNRCRTNAGCLLTRYVERLSTLAAGWDGTDATGYLAFVDFGFDGGMGLAAYPDGRVAAFIETINTSRGHSCTLDFVGQRTPDGDVVWQDLEDQTGTGELCKVTIAVAPGQARVFSENCTAYCGMAGSFEGNYRKQ